MQPADTQLSLVHLFSELVHGASNDGAAFILNSGDVGLLRSLDAVSPSEASRRVDGGASLAAHATHVAFGLTLMNRWARDGGDPFADAMWDDAWKTSDVSAREWDGIRSKLNEESATWLRALGTPRDVTSLELSGMIASVAHLAYHLGAMRQISTSARGPKEGMFGSSYASLNALRQRGPSHGRGQRSPC